MVKLAPLVPQAIGARKLQIRIRTWAVAGPFTFHFCALSFDVLLLRDNHDIPPSREISILTPPLTPLEPPNSLRAAGGPYLTTVGNGDDCSGDAGDGSDQAIRRCFQRFFPSG